MWTPTSTTEQTERIGFFIGKRIALRPAWAKTVLLFGELGSGKTTFVRGLSKGLGIMEQISSPTYALVAEYLLPAQKIPLQCFLHVDLYRADDKSAFSLHELLESFHNSEVATAIEWAERLPEGSFPKNRIEVRFHPIGNDSSGERNIEIKFFDAGVTTEKEIISLQREFAVPSHVLKHIDTVTKVADFFAEQLESNGIPINRELVRAGAQLHDFVRICNFRSLDRKCFFEKITPQKLAIWQMLCRKYKNTHHADAGAEILRKKGLLATADLVAHHNTAAVLGELTLEEKCVLLGDRHVLHDTVVSLEERMQDGVCRHDHNKNPEYEAIRRKTKGILEEVCALAGIVVSAAEKRLMLYFEIPCASSTSISDSKL